MDEFVVKVYIYDLSKGLARSLSMGFLGRQIDGIWHTGVVAYGREFFFGGDGIQSCSPGGTILGQPDSVHDLGMTQIPQDVFMSYLQELSMSSFRGDKYHLLDHNCNTFSNEVAQFLTGQPIPSHITSLPQEVMQTPFGQMIRPMLDSMSVNPGNNDSVLFPTSPARTQQQTRQPQHVSPTKAAATPTPNTLPYKYDDIKVTTGFSKLATSFKEKLSGEDFRMLEEVSEYVSTDDPTWSISPTHIKLMGDLAGRRDLSDKESGIVCGFLRLCVLKADIVSLLSHKKNNSLMYLMHNFDKHQRQAQLSLVRTACNLSSCKEGHDLLLSSEEWLIEDEKTNNSKTTVTVCVTSLLHENTDIIKSGASLAYNLTYFKVGEEVAVELGSALIQALIKTAEPPAAELNLLTLKSCMDASPEVTGLAVVMGLDISKLSSRYPAVNDICQDIKKKLDTFSI